MIEVEIKVRISDPNEIRKSFKSKGGIYKISLLHEDTYFNMPKSLRDFKQTDEALRIRKSIGFDKNLKNAPKKIEYTITYKGKKLDSETKTRKEFEVGVQDGEILKKILKVLDFQEIFTVKKERELYQFFFRDHEIEALIDYIPILKDYFIEVEYIAENVDNIGNTREILFDFLSEFNIERDKSITKSYLELIADKFKSRAKKRL
ncbi:MAG: class IV adenylate cyclase [Promethearchaeota archaeon]